MRADADKFTPYGTREEAIAAVESYKLISAGYNKGSVLYPVTNAEGLATQEYATLVVTMPEDTDDVANHNGINIPKIFLGLNVFATQLSYEEDSYGSDYDIGAPWAGEVDTDWYNTNDNAFVLTTPQQLAGLAELVNSKTDNFSKKTIVLGADIDLNNLEWTPIGTSSAISFNGTFDGDGHTVSNLLITGRKNAVGLFGWEKGTIQNLTVENAKVSGGLRVGVIAGQAHYGLSDITITGHVEVNGARYVGGVAGQGAYNTGWTNITIDVDSTSYVKAISTVYEPGNSDADENGNVIVTTCVGGVLGHMADPNRYFTNITTNIDVYGDGYYVGGAFGLAQYGAILTDITAKGNVIGVNEVSCLGGIVGVRENSQQYIVFNNCEFTGTIYDGNGTDITDGNELYGGLYRASTGTGILIVDSKDEDGNWAVWDTASLANGLTQDGTVKMYKALATMNSTVKAPLEVPADKTVVLDLNGKTAQGKWGFAAMDAMLVNNGTLTVKNGTLTNNNANSCATILNNGTLTLENVTVNGGSYTKNNSDHPDYAIENYGKLTVEAGTVITAVGGGIKTEGAGAETVINGGTITNKSSQFNVSFDAVVHNVYAGENATVTVNGGSFTAGKLTNNVNRPKAEGGKYTANCYVLGKADGATLDVFGGTFNADPSTYVADGYWAQQVGSNYVVIADGSLLVSNVTELQNALDNATEDLTIIVAADITGDVLVTQKKDIDLTVDGSGYKFNGVMTIFGNGKDADRDETFTVRNFNFVAKTGADSCIVSPDRTVYNSYSYAHNVTIDNCTFTDPDGVVDCAAIRQSDGGDENWAILNCTVDNTMHSLVQFNNCEDGLYIYNCTVNSKNGINLNSTINVTIDNCNFNVKGYCVRFGVNSGGNPDEAKRFTISNCTLKSLCNDGDALIILRKDAQKATLILTNNIYDGANKISGTEDATVKNYSVTTDNGVEVTKDLDTGKVTLSDIENYEGDSLTVSDNVTNLGNGVFGGTDIKEVTVSASVTDFGASGVSATGASGGAFKGSNVETIILEDGMVEIPAAAFNGATKLTSVEIPSTVKKIGVNAFRSTAITELVIPASVEEIAYGAFRDMDSLTTVTIEGDAVTLPGYVFRDCSNLRTVYLKVNSLTLNGSMNFANASSNNPNTNDITFYVENAEVAEVVKAHMGTGSYVAIYVGSNLYAEIK